MPFCSRCGKENPQGSRFCNSCGSPLSFSTEPSPHNREEEQNIDYYYRIAIDGISYKYVDRERAIDELKQLARKGSQKAKKRLMDISTDSYNVPSSLQERARDC